MQSHQNKDAKSIIHAHLGYARKPATAPATLFADSKQTDDSFVAKCAHHRLYQAAQDAHEQSKTNSQTASSHLDKKASKHLNVLLDQKNNDPVVALNLAENNNDRVLNKFFAVLNQKETQALLQKDGTIVALLNDLIARYPEYIHLVPGVWLSKIKPTPTEYDHVMSSLDLSSEHPASPRNEQPAAVDAEAYDIEDTLNSVVDAGEFILGKSIDFIRNGYDVLTQIADEIQQIKSAQAAGSDQKADLSDDEHDQHKQTINFKALGKNMLRAAGSMVRGLGEHLSDVLIIMLPVTKEHRDAFHENLHLATPLMREKAANYLTYLSEISPHTVDRKRIISKNLLIEIIDDISPAYAIRLANVILLLDSVDSDERDLLLLLRIQHKLPKALQDKSALLFTQQLNSECPLARCEMHVALLMHNKPKLEGDNLQRENTRRMHHLKLVINETKKACEDTQPFADKLYYRLCDAIPHLNLTERMVVYREIAPYTLHHQPSYEHFTTQLHSAHAMDRGRNPAAATAAANEPLAVASSSRDYKGP